MKTRKKSGNEGITQRVLLRNEGPREWRTNGYDEPILEDNVTRRCPDETIILSHALRLRAPGEHRLRRELAFVISRVCVALKRYRSKKTGLRAGSPQYCQWLLSLGKLAHLSRSRGHRATRDHAWKNISGRTLLPPVSKLYFLLSNRVTLFCITPADGHRN